MSYGATRCIQCPLVCLIYGPRLSETFLSALCGISSMGALELSSETLLVSHVSLSLIDLVPMSRQRSVVCFPWELQRVRLQSVLSLSMITEQTLTSLLQKHDSYLSLWAGKQVTGPAALWGHTRNHLGLKWESVWDIKEIWEQSCLCQEDPAPQKHGNNLYSWRIPSLTSKMTWWLISIFPTKCMQNTWTPEHCENLWSVHWGAGNDPNASKHSVCLFCVCLVLAVVSNSTPSSAWTETKHWLHPVSSLLVCLLFFSEHP